MVTVSNSDYILAWLQCLINPSIKFFEMWQPSSPHPIDKSLILNIHPLSLLPLTWTILELISFITRPSNVVL